MNANDTALLVVDVQEKLVPHILNHSSMVWNIERLLKAANLLNVEVRVSEQYPKGLGKTVSALTGHLCENDLVAEKTMFSCRECEPVFQDLANNGIHNILVCGIETHVCVAQTSLDLIAQGFNVFLCVDAVGSRSQLDHQTAIRRLENSGVTITTAEATMFEWCEHSKNEVFKEVSKLVQEVPA